MIALLAEISFVFLLLLSCATKSTPAPLTPSEISPQLQTPERLGWQKSWEETVNKARKEGKVVIHTTAAPVTRTELVKAFKKKYDYIELEFITGAPTELTPKVFAQRNAGLYLVDLFIAGPATVIDSLKPAGAFDSLDSALLLPQVSNPKFWWQERLPFADKEHHILNFILTPGG